MKYVKRALAARLRWCKSPHVASSEYFPPMLVRFVEDKFLAMLDPKYDRKKIAGVKVSINQRPQRWDGPGLFDWTAHYRKTWQGAHQLDLTVWAEAGIRFPQEDEIWVGNTIPDKATARLMAKGKFKDFKRVRFLNVEDMLVFVTGAAAEWLKRFLYKELRVGQSRPYCNAAGIKWLEEWRGH